MANTDLLLDELWEIAGRQYGTVTLREATTFDIVQARQQAEEVREIIRPDNSREVVVVASPMRAAVALILSQIEALDGESIALTPEMLKGLSAKDFNNICSAIEGLDQALTAVGRSAERGRDDQGGADA